MRNCSWTRSRPVTNSVTPCSTWRRTLTSRNQTAPSGPRRNSQVAAPWRPTARATRTASSPRCLRSAGLSPGAGASSSSFWWRRWAEQSRSPRATTVPCASPSSWTSMCRPSWTNRSRYSDPSPNAASASWAAEASAAWSSARWSTRRMPRPPPPAAAFTRSGQPTSSATAAMWARDAGRSKRAGSSVPGTTGTPASRAARRAASLSPRPASVAGVGPTKTRPAARQASAKAACSARKP